MTVSANASVPNSVGNATTNAIANIGTGQGVSNPGQTAYAFGTGLPSPGYLAALVPASSVVYDALIAAPGSHVLGAGIVGANHDDIADSEIYDATIDFDFAANRTGDLYLGLIGSLVTESAGFPGHRPRCPDRREPRS